MSALTRTFQLGERLSGRRAADLRSALRALWSDAAEGREPGVLSDDLELLRRRFFDPVAQGKRLREELVGLPERPEAMTLPDSLRLAIDSTRAVITPEGRAALVLLDDAQTSDVAVALSEALASSLEVVLLDHYRRWGRHRITQVVALLSDETLRPPAIGLLLTLLVNRSIGPSRAVRRFAEGPERDAIDAAFREPVGRFADAIDPGHRRSLAKERLISGWTLHEVTRRHPQAIAIDEDESVSRVYISDGAQEELVDVVARALAHKHVGLTTAGEAFDELVDALRGQGSTIAGYGMLFERPGDTAALRRDLLATLHARQLELQQA